MKHSDDHDPALDDKLDRLATFSEELAGEHGRLLHLLHLELIRPGAGVWFQRAPEREEKEKPAAKELPPWPEKGKKDPLEEVFGPIADQIRLITPKELDELRRGGSVAGSQPKPDLTKPGDFGSPKPSIPSTKWPYLITHHFDGKFQRIGAGSPACGRMWILDFEHFVHVPSCAGLNYQQAYRATLLRAIADAYRNCRLVDPKCPNARVWMLRAFWNCISDHRGGPMQFVMLKLAVACVSN